MTAGLSNRVFMFVATLAALLWLQTAALAQTTPSTPQKPAAPAQGGTKPSSAPKPAPESKTERLGESQSWSAFAEPERGHKICYMAGHPIKSEPANLKRGDVYIYVTHRPAEKSFNVVSFAAGYPYKEGADAEFTVDGHKFDLFTSKENAWARDAATEKSIVEAMAKGKQGVLKGTSARGTTTLDTYSLAGFSQALGEIDKACGVKR